MLICPSKDICTRVQKIEGRCKHDIPHSEVDYCFTEKCGGGGMPEYTKVVCEDEFILKVKEALNENT